MSYRLVEPEGGERLEVIQDLVGRAGFEENLFEVINAYSMTKYLFLDLLNRAKQLQLVSADYVFEEYDKFASAEVSVKKGIDDIVALFDKYAGQEMGVISFQEALIVFPKALLAFEKLYKKLVEKNQRAE